MGTASGIAARQAPAGPFPTASSIAERISLIAASPLFTGLPRHAYEEIAMLARPRAFARDEMLFMQGQPVRSLALIRSGCVKIMQLAPNGNEVILWMYGTGDIAGTLPGPTSSQHNCSARAMEQTTALVWDNTTLQDLMVQFPQIRNNMSLILVSRLSELEERFREVATEKVAKRIALALQRLLRNVGKKVHGGVEVSLSREELAQMTGTTLFTTSRVLAKWGEMGFILPRRESVLVRDTHRLGRAGDDDFEKGIHLTVGKRGPARLVNSPVECAFSSGTLC